MRAGFIGMGLMGVPMTKRLLAAGHPVRVWNRSADKLAAVTSAGAVAAASVADLVEQSDVVMLCVSDTAAVEQLVFGDKGIASCARAGQLLVDFSSIAPQATRDMAARLQQQTGMEWVDAPVSGGVAGAEQGTLAIMVGGQQSTVDSLRELLAPLSQRVTYMGPVGSGQVTKVCNQMLVSCNVLVMAEVFALAAKAGVQTELLPVALQGGFADSIPLQLTGPKMAKHDFEEIRWHVKTLLKDLDLANTLAQSLQSAVPMAGLGAELMRQHAGKGFADQDPATLVHLYMETLGETKR
ncbi:NAD(P)-dependent oxidoreductase [Oceanobacter mangrovi]|uniref:NAD(P)-dependent oxidoreductase n=1 Tax=Oceanobacter mangrovi TaxID=2862510 RepID=UPI0031BB55B6